MVRRRFDQILLELIGLGVKPSSRLNIYAMVEGLELLPYCIALLVKVLNIVTIQEKPSYKFTLANTAGGACRARTWQTTPGSCPVGAKTFCRSTKLPRVDNDWCMHKFLNSGTREPTFYFSVTYGVVFAAVSVYWIVSSCIIYLRSHPTFLGIKFAFYPLRRRSH